MKINYNLKVFGLQASPLMFDLNKLPSIELKVHTSDTQGHLSADSILQNTALGTPIWFCGSEVFADSIKHAMQRQDRDLNCLHLEYFKMR